ncbi:MAG: metallophosphoesterase [Bacteroidetes bacterium]|nr:metallophosphoesterase [Bacteroidota bacterium]
MKRRNFLHKAALATGALVLPDTLLSFSSSGSMPKKEKLTFGIVADVHHGLMHDTYHRMEKFIGEAVEREVDFIIQLGDFCFAESKSKDFMDLWNQFEVPSYHVLGNHDMDLNSKAQAMDFWGMPDKYYSYDFKGVHFIVLDANYLYQDGKFIDYDNANFYVDSQLRTFINDEQIEWFAADLAASKLPTIIFSHQSLWHYQWGVKNRLIIQKHLEKHREKVICCFNGHNHIDFHHILNGINYVEINSMSYNWLGSKYQAERYSKELHEKFKWLSHIAPYKDPLYAFATLNPKGSMKIEGVRSQWVTPSPKEMGIPEAVFGSQLSPVISDYNLKF